MRTHLVTLLQEQQQGQLAQIHAAQCIAPLPLLSLERHDLVPARVAADEGVRRAGSQLT